MSSSLATLDDALALAADMSAEYGTRIGPLVPGTWLAVRSILANEYVGDGRRVHFVSDAAFAPWRRNNVLDGTVPLLVATLLLVRARHRAADAPPRRCVVLTPGRRAATSLLARALALLERVDAFGNGTLIVARTAHRVATPAWTLECRPARSVSMRSFTADDIILVNEDDPRVLAELVVPLLSARADTTLLALSPLRRLRL
jgi:hypothetical protein